MESITSGSHRRPSMNCLLSNPNPYSAKNHYIDIMHSGRKGVSDGNQELSLRTALLQITYHSFHELQMKQSPLHQSVPSKKKRTKKNKTTKEHERITAMAPLLRISILVLGNLNTLYNPYR